MAVLTEVVEPASAEEARSHAEQLQAASMSRRDSTRSERRSIDEKLSGIPENAETNDEKEGLRQRLKAAIKRSSISVSSSG